MPPPGKYAYYQTAMYLEASQAPAAIARQAESAGEALAVLARRLQTQPPRLVVTLGRGSSDHAATYAKYLIETRLGIPVSSFAPSVGSLYETSPRVAETICLVISQSGRSPDLLAAAKRLKSGGAFVVALVNEDLSPLGHLADLVLPLCAGPEKSVAATKSYIASLAMILRIVQAWSDDQPLLAALDTLPEKLEHAWALDWSPAIPPIEAQRQLFVIGRGLALGIAQEAALKFKETCRLHAEGYSAAEVLHGPAAIIGPDFPVLVFSQNDATRPGLMNTVETLSAKGAYLLLAGTTHPAAQTLPAIDAPAPLEPLLQIQSFYRLANRLSIDLGHDPDHPPHLKKVTETV